MSREPFGSSSIYAQYKVSELIGSKGIKVTLEGQGADELLAGYLGYPGQRLYSILESNGVIAAHRFAKNWANLRGEPYLRGWFYLAKFVMPDTLYKVARYLLGRHFEPAWLDKKFLKNVVLFSMKNDINVMLSTKANGSKRH